MELTAPNGTVSRIVPGLSGGIVTTTWSDADTIVTEYGIAELRGRSVSERAPAHWDSASQLPQGIVRGRSRGPDVKAEDSAG
ncbi:MAG: acetyl-CoA hydrolase/transferase C-terminal domain-containing protein [Hyphomicrobiaceae bacterium]